MNERERIRRKIFGRSEEVEQKQSVVNEDTSEINPELLKRFPPKRLKRIMDKELRRFREKQNLKWSRWFKAVSK